MTTRVLTGTYSAGYTITPGVTTLRLTRSGYVEGSGVASPIGATGSYAIVNHGRIFEVYSTSDTRRDDGVYLGAGGSLTNGSNHDTLAHIEGYRGVSINYGAATVHNFGTIIGDYRSGVALSHATGNVVNGSQNDTSALIQGGAHSLGVGLVNVAGVVRNFGTIAGYNGVQIYSSPGSRVINGSAADTSASITATEVGVQLETYGVRVVNFGAISGMYGITGFGGSVINGSGLDTTAQVTGSVSGVSIARGRVTNYATITGVTNYGVHLGGSGRVVNGSATDTSAVIQGATGVYITNLFATAERTRIVNYGTIIGTGPAGRSGISVEAGATATVTNFGTIASSRAGGSALAFNSSTDVLIVETGCAFVGAVTGDGGTLELASGVGSLAVRLADGRVSVSGSMASTTFREFGVLKIDAGAQFTGSGAESIAGGQVLTDAGALLLGGTGRAGIGNAGLIETTGSGVLTLDGAIVNTGTVLAGGGTLTITGAVSGGGVLATAGGTLIVDGAVTGKETAAIAGGAVDFNSFFTGDVTFAAAGGQLGLAQSQSFAGIVSGFSNSGKTSFDLGDIGFVDAGEAVYTEFNKGFGDLTVTDGTHSAHISMFGNYRNTDFITSSDGHGGVIIVASKPPAHATAPHAFISAMASLGGPSGHALPPGEAWSVREPMLSRPRVMAA